MSHSYPSKNIEELENQDSFMKMASSELFNKSNTLIPSTNSIRNDSSLTPSNESTQSSKKPVIKSCACSTVMFSLNFVSSILVINLAKW